VAGCGSSNNDSGGGTSTAASGSAPAAKTESLTVAIAAPDVAFTQLYVAQAKGYFKKAGLDVKITDPGSNLLTSVLTGQADLGLSGTGAALAPALKGQDTSIIYNNTDSRTAGWIAANPKVKSPADCKRIGALAPGSGSYASAVQYATAFGKKWNIVPMQDFPTIVASVVSGSLDCATGTWGTFSAAVDAKKLRLIVDPRFKNTLPPGIASDIIPSGVVFGMSKVVASKAEAVQRFITGYQNALADVRKETPAALAGVLKTFQDFSTQKATVLASAIDATRFTFAPADGFMDQTQYGRALVYFDKGGVAGVNASKPAFSYGKRVNMALWKQATTK
jgi:ABC-type nitrate/sulfonate/bicarbonate transport system substrate-binding protein